jgi:hypothetical protein
MQTTILFFSIALPVMPVADSSAGTLDMPDDAQATAAYRAVPAVAQKAGADQRQTVHVGACKPAAGKPGIDCKVAVKNEPSAAPQDIAIHFERGPDAAWVATLEQTAP